MVASRPDSRVELHVRLPIDAPELPSLADVSFPAGRFEREMQDLFGVRLAGHHQPARLVLHQHWPQGWYPMRHDAGPPPPFDEETESYPFLTVEGPGVYEIPVGPVHAGIIEPGHFRFSVVGETILNMKARLWFVHKGIERLFQGRDIECRRRTRRADLRRHRRRPQPRLLPCRRKTPSDAPHRPQPQSLRALLLELERLYNHVTDLGAMGNDVGFGIAHANTMRIREQFLRLNARITGHRLLRGGVVPGGAQVDWLPDAATLTAIRDDIGEVVDIMMANTTVVDRFSGTSVLSNDDATQIGTLGYVARASGIDARCASRPPVRRRVRAPDHSRAGRRRRDEPLPDPRRRDRRVRRARSPNSSPTPAPVRTAHQSTRIAVAATSDTASDSSRDGGERSLTASKSQPTDRSRRVKIVDPSFFNWPALPVALAGDTIVPDFPLTNKSFNLSYAGNDL